MDRFNGVCTVMFEGLQDGSWHSRLFVSYLIELLAAEGYRDWDTKCANFAEVFVHLYSISCSIT